MRRWVSGSLLTAIFLIAGCSTNTGANSSKASSNPASDSALLQSASRLQQRALAAYASGDLVAAAAGYEAAATIYETLALTEPQAVARLSAARAVTESRGGLERAAALVQRVLADAEQLSPPTRITAHGRAAALYLAQGGASLPLANTQLQAAQNLCAGACPQTAALWVLRSRLQLAQGDAMAAIASASQAVSDSAEQANALRARAQAQAQLGQHSAVIADASAALALDRSAGQATRVLLDLQLLAAAHRALNQLDQAQYFDNLAARSAQAQQVVERGLP
jgi:tetratricopeptide (TPR) repeat protein